jgi:hypothetical protein
VLKVDSNIIGNSNTNIALHDTGCNTTELLYDSWDLAKKPVQLCIYVTL